MSFKVLTLEDKHEWGKYLDKLPVDQQDVYYSPEYYTLFEHMGNGKAYCFIFEDEQNQLVLYPFLMNSISSLGYELDKEYYDIQGAYGYNGLVSSSHNRSLIDSFYECFDAYCQKNNIVAEFTRFNPLIRNEKFSESNMKCLLDRKTVFIDLEKTYEELRRQYQRSTRKQISRMERNENIHVSFYDKCSPSIIETAYNIYLESMHRLDAKKELYFSFEFFRELLNMDSCKLIMFEYNGKPVSCISFYHFNDKIHGFLGGTLNDFLRLSPFSLLYDHMIRYGVDNGAKILHVGGGTTNDPEDKLLSYKLNFSKKTEEFFIGKKIHNAPVYESIIEQWEEKCITEEQKRNVQLLKYRNIES
jgi:hypothetical protein